MACRIALLAALLAAVSCTAPRHTEPRVREIYRLAARREARNPVIVIHGILGSRLQQRSTGKVVWGAFTNEAIDPETPEGARALALPLLPPADASAYDSDSADVFATRPLNAIRVGLLFGVVNVQIYANILRSLGVGGYADPVLLDPASPEYPSYHFTCYTYFYDWRLDNVTNAILFGRWLRDLRGEVRRRARGRIEELRRSGDRGAVEEAAELESWLQRDLRFDVVAHSMGGLIANYYLRYGAVDLPADGSLPPVTWAGAEDIARLIEVGTPNLGAMDSLRNLTRGFKPGFLLPYYHPAVLGTMPSIYQLLPRMGQGLVLGEDGEPSDVDLFDVGAWDRNGWGLLDPAADGYLRWLLPDLPDREARRRRARAYMEWCLSRARAFHAALDQDPPATPCPTELRLFASDTIPTLARTRLYRRDDGTLWPLFDGPDWSEPGDGTVARYSAVGDRRPGRESGALDSAIPWDSVTFLPDDHIGLTQNPVFTDNLLFYLLEQQPRRR
ncbi:MAG: hypothetical protein Fur0037_06110 [Planctomycetota bacterium]